MRGNGRFEAIRVHLAVGQREAGARDERQGVGVAQAPAGALGSGGHGLHGRDLQSERAQAPDEGAGDDRLADAGVGTGDEDTATAHRRTPRPIEPGAIRASPPVSAEAVRPAAPQAAP